MRRVLVLAVFLLSVLTARAAPPGEVGASLRFDDETTLVWDGVAGADRYNAYRGAQADGSDLACLVFRTVETTAQDPDLPDRLFTYLVGAWNPDGEGPLGQGSDGGPRQPSIACTDDDNDGVRDDRDNCPGLANPGQDDQDLDLEGDPCDPSTYDFEGDQPGLRPAGMTQCGGDEASFLVRDHSGDLGVAYDGGLVGVHDRFDPLDAWRPFQDLDVFVDTVDLSGETLTLELWSEGTWNENAGGGLQVRIGSDERVAARVRRAREMTDLGDSGIPFQRLRLRLRKGVETESLLHVDTWNGSDWNEDAAIFTVADDHRLVGRLLSVSQLDGGRRPVVRATANPLPPSVAFSVSRSFDGLTDWKLFQRGSAGTASLPVPFAYTAAGPVRLQARVVDSDSGQPLPGHDFPDHVWDLPAAPGGRRDERLIPDVPEGGNYDVEARLVNPDDQQVLGQDTVVNVAVGDVFLAAGQSNMSGYSGSLVDAEPPVPAVHLFGNDYVWKQAAEPMDTGTDQVDRVSEEFPAHSLMLRFAKEINGGTGIPVGVVPAPLGGTNLHTQWQRRDGDPDHRGTLYGSAIHRVLAQGYEHPIRGVIWYQGESDSGRTTAQYLADLEELVANFRTDLGNPNLFFGNCQLATWLGSDLDLRLMIQEAQRQQASNDALSAVIATIDQPRSDTVHLNVAGYKETGARLARAVLAGSYGIVVPLGPQILSLQLQNHGKEITIVYDKEVAGGLPGLYRVFADNGLIGVSSVTNSADTVVLRLAKPAKGTPRVSYGWSNEPTEGWIFAADGGGAALVFRDVAVSP